MWGGVVFSVIILSVIIAAVVFAGIYVLFYVQYLNNPIFYAGYWQTVPPFTWPPWQSPYWHALFG
jgi:hypothetical protein